MLRDGLFSMEFLINEHDDLLEVDDHEQTTPT